MRYRFFWTCVNLESIFNNQLLFCHSNSRLYFHPHSEFINEINRQLIRVKQMDVMTPMHRQFSASVLKCISTPYSNDVLKQEGFFFCLPEVHDMSITLRVGYSMLLLHILHDKLSGLKLHFPNITLQRSNVIRNCLLFSVTTSR
jgi:hypothetical protein